jgi:hypothetical protein
MIGASFNQYQILGLLGSGGMGQVFRARDTKLGREVAVKVLPAEFAADPDRLRRFDQEARTLATLNHPNVLVIYDSGVHEGAPYLVTELLEGQSLRALLARGPPSLRRALEQAQQIADGLAAAHARGVVHRDLKPENLFVSHDGRVKILDFGLAKLTAASKSVRSEATASAAPDAPTQLQSAADSTEPGRILGTVGYMAPEQVNGHEADHRADVFSFGAILYEMLSGQRAFRRETSVQTMNAILTEEPAELRSFNSAIAPALQRVVTRCLEKAPERRFQTASDLAFALGNVDASSTATTVRAPAQGVAWRRRGVRQAAWVASGVGLMIALGVALRDRWGAGSDLNPGSASAAASGVRKLMVQLPITGTNAATSEITALVISPDGRKLAFMNGEGLWLHRFDQIVAPVRLAASRGVFAPFWSPRSADVAYFEGNRLWRVPVGGGPPVELCEAPFSQSAESGGAWLTDDRIVFATGSTGLIEVPAHGGRTNMVLRPTQEQGDFHTASALPNGRGVLFVTHSGTNTNPHVIAVWSRTGEHRALLKHSSSVDTVSSLAYSHSGHVLFEVEGDQGPEIWAFAFSLSRLERTGEPFRMAVQMAFPSVARDGTLLCAPRPGRGVFDLRQLIWVGRGGQVQGTLGEPRRGLAGPRLSPDGLRAAVAAGGSFSELDIWLYDVLRGTANPLTRNELPESQPYWTHDGQRLIFSRAISNSLVSIGRSVDGVGAEETVFEGGCSCLSPRTGEYFLVIPPRPGFSRRGYFLLNDPEKKLVLFPEGLDRSFVPKLSPDDRLLVYSSAESGHDEIYVIAFPGFTNKTLVSSGGGKHPQWRSDGSELFYLSQNGREMWAVAVNQGAARPFSEPKRLFVLPEPSTPTAFAGVNPFDVTADGERFLMLQPMARGSGPRLETDHRVLLVENWFEEFGARR